MSWLTCLIAGGGDGLRLAELTNAVPKSMAPLGTTPTIQHLVREAALTRDISDVVIVTGPHGEIIENHFTRNIERERKAAGKPELLARIKEPADLAEQTNLRFVSQTEPLGTAHVLRAALEEGLVTGDEPIVFMLGDDVIHPEDPLLHRMIETYYAYGSSVISVMNVPPTQAKQYGCAVVRDDSDGNNGLTIDRLVEKPTEFPPPSNLAVIGRYVLSSRIWEVLENLKPASNGELQLTDALQTLAGLEAINGGGVRAVHMPRLRRLDTGNRLALALATDALSQEDPEIGAAYRRATGREGVQKMPIAAVIPSPVPVTKVVPWRDPHSTTRHPRHRNPVL